MDTIFRVFIIEQVFLIFLWRLTELKLHPMVVGELSTLPFSLMGLLERVMSL